MRCAWAAERIIGIGLFDAILLKENHIALAGGVKAALDKAHVYASSQITCER